MRPSRPLERRRQDVECGDIVSRIVEQGGDQAKVRTDLENAVTREFCAECGTHILAKSPALPGAVLLKVGTFDDPSLFGTPQMAIFAIDRQAFHQVPEGVPAFERGPGSAQVS